MVKENDVEGAMNVLNGIMANEGMTARWKLTRRYEKPTWARNRINFERSKAIYNEDMDKILLPTHFWDSSDFHQIAATVQSFGA